MTDRVQRGDSGLPHGGVGVIEQAKKRFEGVLVAEPCERSRDRQLQLGIGQRRDERPRRFAIPNPAERDNRRLADFQILGAKLVDQQIDHAAAVTNERLDGLSPDQSLTKQTCQRALDRGTAEPSHHPGDAAQAFGARVVRGIQQILGTRRRHMPAHDLGDVIARAVATLVSFPHAAQRIGARLGGAARLVQHLHERHYDQFVAELAQGFRHDRAKPSRS